MNEVIHVIPGEVVGSPGAADSHANELQVGVKSEFPTATEVVRPQSLTPLGRRKRAVTAEMIAAFEMFKDMGSTRKMADLAKRLGKPYSTVTKWSSWHNWPERIAEYGCRATCGKGLENRDA